MFTLNHIFDITTITEVISHKRAQIAIHISIQPYMNMFPDELHFLVLISILIQRRLLPARVPADQLSACHCVPPTN